MIELSEIIVLAGEEGDASQLAEYIIPQIRALGKSDHFNLYKELRDGATAKYLPYRALASTVDDIVNAQSRLVFGNQAMTNAFWGMVNPKMEEEKAAEGGAAEGAAEGAGV